MPYAISTNVSRQVLFVGVGTPRAADIKAEEAWVVERKHLNLASLSSNIIFSSTK